MKIRSKATIFGCAVTFLAMSNYADAADIYQPKAAVSPTPKIEEEVGPWQIRGRALTVLPMNQGSVHAAGLGRITSDGLNFQTTVTPELDISYFFTKNIAAELILGTTSSKIYGRGKTMRGLGLHRRLGKTWILPPTLTLQYHFTDFGKFQPYIGAGVNYTFFYSESDWALKNMTVDGTWGGAVQLGMDYMVSKHWGLNFDVKKLFLAPSYHAKLRGNTILGAAAEGTRITGRARLDPWLIGAGVTYRF